MKRGRKPYAEWDDQLFRRLWYDRSIKLEKVAELMGRSAVRPLLIHAKALGLPQRRMIGGLVGCRPKGRHRFVSPLLIEYVKDEPPFAAFVCSVCGMRSLTPVHPKCEERQRGSNPEVP